MVMFVYCRHIYRSANVMDLHLSSTLDFGGTMLLISYSFLCVFLLCVFTLCVPYFDVHDDFRIENDVRFVFTSSCWYEGSCLI